MRLFTSSFSGLIIFFLIILGVVALGTFGIINEIAMIIYIVGLIIMALGTFLGRIGWVMLSFLVLVAGYFFMGM